MDNNTPQQYSNINSPQVAPVKKNKLNLFLVLLVVLMTAAVAGVYFWQQGIVKQKQSLVNEKQTQLDQANDKFQSLTASIALPTKNQVGHTNCSKQDFSNTVYAALTPAPVDGYQAYIQLCLGDGQQVPSLQGLTPTSTGTVVVLKTDSKGTKTFKFGAGTSEPFCISERILPATVAANLSAATKIPVCKTF